MNHYSLTMPLGVVLLVCTLASLHPVLGAQGCGTDSGETCRFFNCDKSSNTSCSNGHCVCLPGQCAYHGGCTLNPPIRYISNDAIEKHLPLPPADYPENLKGLLWMDQTGAISPSDVAPGAPDLVMSMGDPSFGGLDQKTRELSVNILGPAWQWQNNAKAYGMYSQFVNMGGFHYDFVWNDNYTFAQIYPVIYGHRVPKNILSFTMEKQYPKPGECPPKPGAPKPEVAKCAQWRRVSTIFSGFPGVQRGPTYYYAFVIVDASGNRVQPYYDGYLRHANNVSAPSSADAASTLGVPLAGVGTSASSSFVGDGELYNQNGGIFPGFP